MVNHLLTFMFLISFSVALVGAEKNIPLALKDWGDWATWDNPHKNCPASFDNASQPHCVWPSSLSLLLDAKGGSFSVSVTVYHESFLFLPGDKDAWPCAVKVGDKPWPVTDGNGQPRVLLPPGEHRVSGKFIWENLPASISLSRQYGVVSMSVEGKTVDVPNWERDGKIWLKPRAKTDEQSDQKDMLSVQVHRLLEDGMPLWLRTDVELSVSGKSREESLGTVLPEGWKLAAIHSQLPVRVDDAGAMKVQVRAGRWHIQVDAFSVEPVAECRFAPGASPAAAQEWVAFKAMPEMRVVELRGIDPVDVTQTSFPHKWREWPVYLWKTDGAFRIEEKMRGMGMQKPDGLKIRREIWLDEKGGGLTYRDRLSGKMQQMWRLDSAESCRLGTVKINGQPQLVTKNPRTGLSGMEVRSRNFEVEAVGRSSAVSPLHASGWKTDADSLDMTIHIPPGWRAFAVFGGDRVSGDWLTAWTLLDLFLLMVVGLTVFRVWGFAAAAIAFLAFGLSYHEMDAPRFAWLVLLGVVVLRRFMSDCAVRRLLTLAKWVSAAVLLCWLAPFIAAQIQGALYPQLEKIASANSVSHRLDEKFLAEESENEVQADALALRAEVPQSPVVQGAPAPSSVMAKSKMKSQSKSDSYYQGNNISRNSNLAQQPKAKIQTGPGVPEWHWQQPLVCRWDGPVSSNQEIRPVLISPAWQRLITVIRVVTLILFLAVLLGKPVWLSSFKFGRGFSSAALAVMFLAGFLFVGQSGSFAAETAVAQGAGLFPDKEMINTLRERILEPSKAFPKAADIASVSLNISGSKIILDAEVHAAVTAAVPMPDGIPEWAPTSIVIDGNRPAVSRRHEGKLWVMVPQGVHRVRVESLLPPVPEWSLSFALKPRYFSADASEWQVKGLKKNGVPENQIFFVKKQKTPLAVDEVGYDRNDFRAVALFERSCELGILWRVQNSVKRLSQRGKAISLEIPLLDGEKVLSTNISVENGKAQIRLGAQEDSVSWESEWVIVPKFDLEAAKTGLWVERWRMQLSPVWNLTISGLHPVFESARGGDGALEPVWRPWPGEKVSFEVGRPEDVTGATQTVHRVRHQIRPGKNCRHSNLSLLVQSSLGEDFPIQVGRDGEQVEITQLKRQGHSVPVRLEGNRVIVPLKPGQQEISLEWKTLIPLGTAISGDEVRLPVESANITTTMHLPRDRWILWADGPLRGPAVRFWGILLCAIGAGWILSRLPSSPLKAHSWILLCVGLTQVPFPVALVVLAWFFLFIQRGEWGAKKLSWWVFNLAQLLLLGATVVMIGCLIYVVRQGLLGSPEMWIAGNGSANTTLIWFQPLEKSTLPVPSAVSISLWFYRVLMLLWALWLAHSLIEWMRWAWKQGSESSLWKPWPKKSDGQAAAPRP